MIISGIETFAIGCDQTDFPVKSSFFAKKLNGVPNILDYYETLNEYEEGFIHIRQLSQPLTLESFRIAQMMAIAQ